MKKLVTLMFIISIITVTVSCQKEEIKIEQTAGINICPAQKGVPNSVIKLNEIGTEKQIQNVVACKVCHSNKDIAAVQ